MEVTWTEERVKKLHVVLTLSGDSVGFDNPLTGVREWWKDGKCRTQMLMDTDSMNWMEAPNPWQNINQGGVIPYVFD